jgi:mRNA interferase RelE/StbE
LASNFYFSQRAERDLKKLDPQVQNRIRDRLIEFSDNPLFYARKLANSKIGDYRFRVGDYRISFDFDGDDIYIVRIGHRKDIYR